MENLAKVIQAIASLMWPLIGLFVLWYFRDGISKIIDSAKGRKITVKVGGQELTVDEASHQQESQINELRQQIISIQQFLNMPPKESAALLATSAETLATSNSVLWVDDHPKNNSYLISAIKDSGYNVELALSTDEALRLIEKTQYRIIISDMGRTERGSYSSEAGLELLSKLRNSQNTTPFIVFCSASGARKFKEKVISLGGITATSSSTVLFSLIKEYLPAREG